MDTHLDLPYLKRTTNEWITTAEGQRRFYFANNSHTYFTVLVITITGETMLTTVLLHVMETMVHGHSMNQWQHNSDILQNGDQRRQWS